MANMSYCRFQNTLQALQDCKDHLRDPDLSKKEKDARETILFLCGEIACDTGEYDAGEFFLDSEFEVLSEDD